MEMVDSEDIGMPENVLEPESLPVVAPDAGDTGMEVEETREEAPNVSVSLTPVPDSTDGMPEPEASSSTTPTVVSDDSLPSGDTLPDFTILLRRERINRRTIMTRTVTLTHIVSVTPVDSVHPSGNPTEVVAPPAPTRLLPQSIEGWAGFTSQRLAAPWRPSRPRKVIKRITWAVPLPKRRDQHDDE